jgi:hypothetical protein
VTGDLQHEPVSLANIWRRLCLYAPNTRHQDWCSANTWAWKRFVAECVSGGLLKNYLKPSKVEAVKKAIRMSTVRSSDVH